MVDRRAGKRKYPYVRKQPRSRNKSGKWKKKKRQSSTVGRKPPIKYPR
jgi:hypothetical protein